MKTLLERTELPQGFRDFGPAAAEAITNVGGRLDRLYSRWGFRRVLTPSIESEEVIRPGLGPRAAEGAFRIVDPLTGQSLVFRPDITPQVARLVATGAAGSELPLKLFYRGSIMRRLSAGASGMREIYQSGVESFGAEPELADAETVALALEAAGEGGLSGTVLELGDVRFVEGILGLLRIDDDARTALTSAIDRKARADIEAFLRDYRLPANVRRVLEALPDLFGAGDVFFRAGKLDLPPLSRLAVSSLEKLLKSLEKAGVRIEGLAVDLAEVRGLDYYTGLLFGIYAHGAAQPVLRGGRYDKLAGAFGRDLPAVGFAADLQLLARLGESGNAAGEDDLAVADVVLYRSDGRHDAALQEASKLRRQGQRVVLLGANVTRQQAEQYARALGSGVKVAGSEKGRHAAKAAPKKKTAVKRQGAVKKKKRK